MPCTQGAASDILHSQQAYRGARNAELEGMLCALLTQLELNLGEDQANNLIIRASIQGQCPLGDFWTTHKSSDESRIKLWVSKLSDAELKMTKFLLLEGSVIEGFCYSELKEFSKTVEHFSKHEQALMVNMLKSKSAG